MRITPDREHPGIQVTWLPNEPFPTAPQQTVDHVYACLQAADELLTSLGVAYIAYGGTLLGAVRHGGMIPWDTDGDLGVLAEDLRAVRAARKRLTSQGFGLGVDRRFSNYKVYPLDGYKISPWNEYRFPWVDLMPLAYRAGRLTYAKAVSRRTWPESYFEQDTCLETLQRYPFGPLTLTAPPEPATHRHLTRWFGPSWRTEAEIYRIAGRRGTTRVALADFPPAHPSTPATDASAGSP